MKFKPSELSIAFRYYNPEFPDMYCDCIFLPLYGNVDLYIVKILDVDVWTEEVFHEDFNCNEDDLEMYILDFMRRYK